MSWYYLFSVFNLKTTAYLQHQGFWEYYKKRNESEFYERVIEDHETVIETYIKSNDDKVSLLKKSLNNIYLSAIMFVILVIIYLFFKYIQ